MKKVLDIKNEMLDELLEMLSGMDPLLKGDEEEGGMEDGEEEEDDKKKQKKVLILAQAKPKE
jgi:hypothetical protein